MIMRGKGAVFDRHRWASKEVPIQKFQRKFQIPFASVRVAYSRQADRQTDKVSLNGLKTNIVY